MNKIILSELNEYLENNNAHSIGLLIDLLVSSGRLIPVNDVIEYKKLQEAINQFIDKAVAQNAMIIEKYAYPLF